VVCANSEVCFNGDEDTCIERRPSCTGALCQKVLKGMMHAPIIGNFLRVPDVNASVRVPWGNGYNGGLYI